MKVKELIKERGMTIILKNEGIEIKVGVGGRDILVKTTALIHLDTPKPILYVALDEPIIMEIDKKHVKRYKERIKELLEEDITETGDAITKILI